MVRACQFLINKGISGRAEARGQCSPDTLLNTIRSTPTVHAVPGEAFGPLLLADQRVAVDVAGAREHLGALLRLDGLLGDAFQVAVLVAVQHAVAVGVHRAELPLVDEQVGLVVVRLDDAAVVAAPLGVEDVDEVVVELGLVGLLAGAVAALGAPGAASVGGFLLAPAVGLGVGFPPDGGVRKGHSLKKMCF